MIGGLFKKAHELSVLCSVDIAVIIFGSNKKLYEYSSGDMSDILGRYTYVCSSHSLRSVHNAELTHIYSMKLHMSTKDLQTFKKKAVQWMMMMMTLTWAPLHQRPMNNICIINICSIQEYSTYVKPLDLLPHQSMLGTWVRTHSVTEHPNQVSPDHPLANAPHVECRLDRLEGT